MRVNVGKRGASISVGGRGATVNFGRNGVRSTVGIPGTGLSYTTTSGGRRRRGPRQAAATGSHVAPAQGGEVAGFLALCALAVVVALLARWTLFLSVPVLAFVGWGLWYQSWQMAKVEAILAAETTSLAAAEEWRQRDVSLPSGSSLDATAAPPDHTPDPARTYEAERRDAPLSAAAQGLLAERQMGWEYLLFAQVLMDEVALLNPEPRRASQSRRSLTGERLVVPELLDWIEARHSEASDIGSDLDVQVNRALPAALGPPGQPADPTALVAVARAVAACHARAIAWRARVGGVAVPRGWERVQQAMAQFCDGLATAIERFGPEMTGAVRAAAARHAAGEPAGEVQLRMTVEVPPHALKAFEAALATLAPQR